MAVGDRCERCNRPMIYELEPKAVPDPKKCYRNLVVWMSGPDPDCFKTSPDQDCEAHAINWREVAYRLAGDDTSERYEAFKADWVEKRRVAKCDFPSPDEMTQTTIDFVVGRTQR